MPLGAGAGLRAAQPAIAELGHQPAVADRGRPAENQRVGSTLHRRNPATHAGRDRAPQSRPPRRGLAGRPRGRCRRSGLAALPAAIRQPVCQGALTTAPARLVEATAHRLGHTPSCVGRKESAIFTSGATRSMKMGTIASPWRYDAMARHALQPANLGLPAILSYACKWASAGYIRGAQLHWSRHG